MNSDLIATRGYRYSPRVPIGTIADVRFIFFPSGEQNCPQIIALKFKLRRNQRRYEAALRCLTAEALAT
jgi:hypothetical protein